MTLRRASPGVLACLALVACKTNPSDDERTLRRMQEEAERARARKRPEEALARALESDPAAFVPRALPGTVKPVPWGPLAVELRQATSGQSLPSGRLTLTTAERFLKLELSVFNGGNTEAPLDLSKVRLRTTEETSELAPDAQSAAGTRQLQLQLKPQETRAVTLLFEVSPTAVNRPMMLSLPSTDGKTDTLNF